MLTLTRKEGQCIILHAPMETVIITLKSTRRGQARLGVLAPKYVDIHRDDTDEFLPPNRIYTSIEHCPRCGGTHRSVEITVLKQSSSSAARQFFTSCPETGHPVIL
jgi:carbon storage regulator CsrA